MAHELEIRTGNRRLGSRRGIQIELPLFSSGPATETPHASPENRQRSEEHEATRVVKPGEDGANIKVKPAPNWLGSKTVRYNGDLRRICEVLPTFKRAPFSLTRGTSHPQKDIIVKMPNDDSQQPLPVAVVSKSYRLLQHLEVVDTAIKAMRALGIHPDEASVQLEMTDFGERIRIAFPFSRDYQFDPGDRKPALPHLLCVNSVDGSMAYATYIRWVRLVCSNGMTVLSNEPIGRQFHTPALTDTYIQEVITAGLERFKIEKRICAEWFHRAISPKTLTPWVDGPVREAWGVKAAVRAYHIALTGKDAALALPFESGAPSEKTVRLLSEVPGSLAPAGNVYAAAQALFWLVSQLPAGDLQWSRERKIPKLLSKLISMN